MGSTKFPSNNKIMYVTDAIVNGSFSDEGVINLPKDLSLLNRRGYSSCAADGTPYVFHCRVDVFPSGLDGSGYTTASATDVRTTLKFVGAQNTWVMKNASKMWKKAYMKAFKKAGVKTKDLGAYAKDIRFCYDSASETFLTPYDGLGQAFAGGTWDTTTIFTESDTSGFKLKLVGTGIDEDSANTATAIHIGHSYLAHRPTVPSDSNLESSNSPAQYSVLNELLRDVQTSAVDDNIVTEAQDKGDNPPYDEFVTGDTNNDLTETVELGRIYMSPVNVSTPVQSIEIAVPFGILNVKACHQDPGNDSGFVDDLAYSITVLGISEMQG